MQESKVKQMRKEFFVLGLIATTFVAACDPDDNPVVAADAGFNDASFSYTDSGVPTASEVCKDNCGTFTMNSVKYDCPAACPLSQTCAVTKHKCCVTIQYRLDLFCKYYPYYNSTFTDAGSTPADSSATRIPSPEEVGFLYCAYPGFVNCKQL